MEREGASHHTAFMGKESGGRGSLRFPCVTLVVETSSDRVTFRILSNNDTAPPRKQPTALTHWLFPQKGPTTDFPPDSKCGSDWRCCKQGEGGDCRCIEFVAADWCARKWLKLYQTMRNLTSGDLGIRLVVIQGRRGEGSVSFNAPLDDWVNDGFSSVGSWLYSR